MNVLIGATPARLADRDLLGAGGEARVYRFGDRALKIYHPIDPAIADAAAQRARKLDKLRHFPAALPAEVVAPLELVTDRKGALLGYAMQAVEGADDLLRLSQRGWRQGVVGSAQVIALFRVLHRLVSALHARSVVVGDFNDSNVLFAGERAWLIDADSMQFEGFPCVVGHERFLDPRLYGVDLSARPAFTPESDWYAYAVLLFGSLLYVHPYGGTHPTLRTPLRRAEARHSILRADVRYPRAALPFAILPDALLAWFEAVFDKDVRAPFPEALLAMSWTRCSCGLEHARARCPECAAPGVAALRAATRHAGRCTARVIFRTGGRLLAADSHGGLRYAYEDAGIVRREDGSPVLEQAIVPGMRFALSGPTTWMGLRGRLVAVQRGQVQARLGSGRLGTGTVFAANARTCLRTEGDWLIDTSTGNRLGTIVEGQTWLWLGECLGLGFYRVGALHVFFLLHAGRPGLVPISLPPIEGRLIDATCVFDERHALLALAVERDGKQTRSMFLIGQDAQLRAQVSGPPDDTRMLQSLRGKALLDGRVVCATDDGLLSLRTDGDRLVEGTLFSDTQAFVAAGVDLLPAPGGDIYVVSTTEITQLSIT